MVAQDSWTTVGAQLFPASPEKIDEESYTNWQVENNVIYVSGDDPERLVIVTPSGDPAKGC